MENQTFMPSDDSELLLLISSDSSDKPLRSTSQSESTFQKKKIEIEDKTCTVGASEDGIEATILSSDQLLRQMKVRNKPVRSFSQQISSSYDQVECTNSGERVLKSPSKQHHKKKIDPVIQKLSNRSEDSSLHRIPTSTMTSDVSSRQTEKSGRSSIRSWLRKKILRRNDDSKKDCKMSRSNCTKKPWQKGYGAKQIPEQVLVQDDNESIDTNIQEELSTLMGSLSLSDVHKALGSEEESMGQGSFVLDDDRDPFAILEMESPKAHSKQFKNQLQIYKASSSKEKNDVLQRVKRLQKEASFMLLSFSLVPSESGSTNGDDNTDAETTEDNLADAIAKEMDLRRLIMGDPDPDMISIREVTIPAVKAKDILSPSLNSANSRRTPVSTTVDKPQTPLEQLAGFFFGRENMDASSACGTQSSTYSPTHNDGRFIMKERGNKNFRDLGDGLSEC